MSALLKAIGKRLLIAVGVLVIALALLVGAGRLVIAQLPGYQDELSAWVTEELGVEARFAAFDARLGLFGPELDLRDVSLRAVGSGRDFLDAARVSLTLDPWALVLQQRVATSRLTVDGASIGIERGADDSLQIQGLNESVGAQGDLASILPVSIDVVIRDSQVLYIDRIERAFWQFAAVDLTLERSAAQLTVRASAQPPEGLAQSVDLALRQSESDRTLNVQAALAGANLDGLGRLLPDPRWRELAGTGDIDFTAIWLDRRLLQATTEVALDDVSFDVADAEGIPFDRVAVQAAWNRVGDTGFAVTLDEIEVRRDGLAWPGPGVATISRNGQDDSFAATADFIRLEDVGPLVQRFAPADVAQHWAELAPRGDVEAMRLSIANLGAEPEIELEGRLAGGGVRAASGWPGFDGIAAQVRFGTGAGTLNLASGPMTVDWPSMWDRPVRVGALDGTVVWRRGQDGLRILSDALTVDLDDEPLVANFEVALPNDDQSPYVDIHARLAEIDVPTAMAFLPKMGLPASVRRWLQASLQDGIGRDARLELTGRLSDFPFTNGDGRFLVTADVSDAVIEFIPDWPRAVGLTGKIRFENAGFAASGSGGVLNSTTETLAVAIDNMAAPIFELDTVVGGPLADVLGFVQTSPLISTHLGPGFDRLTAPEGSAATAIDLDLPLLNFSEFMLTSRLDIDAGRLRIDGFGPEASELRGGIDIRNSTVSGDDIGAVFLGGPVTATVIPSDDAGYRTDIVVRGETSSAALADEFSLPLSELVEGQTRWNGRLRLPSADMPGPLAVEVESNLSGMALRFPEPLAKPPGDAMNLRLRFEFDGERALSLLGNLGATRRFEFLLDRDDESYRLSRGAVTFGGDDPLLPLRDGIVVSGRVPQLRLDDWLAVTENTSIDRARPLFSSAELEIGDFEAFGQTLGQTTLAVARGDQVWGIDLDSAAIAGRVEVPRDLRNRAPVIADMERVYLAVGERPPATTALDPRELPGLRLRAAEFGFGARELGQVEVDVVADPRGLRLTEFVSATTNFSLEASGSWLTDGIRSTSRIAATVASGDVAATLNQLGIDPVVEAESGELTASLYWEGPPAGGWLDHLYGDVALSVQTGSLIEIDPGAGRVVGLMSIAALPRRLMLDFRDVFNKGFSFDEITGSFTIEDGNAFTDDLKLSGPTAEIGVIGRTGLRDRDYQQQAVVTAEPSNMLPTVGGLLGGPGVGAALLIFTRIFKEQLKGIGRASYCVTGSWDQPEVDRILPERADGFEACVALPASMSEPGAGG